MLAFQQNLIRRFSLVLVIGLASCKSVEKSSVSSEGSVPVLFHTDLESPGVSISIPDISNFHPEPLLCDSYHSKEYACDGYTQKNLPSGKGSANPTPEIETSSAPPPGFVGLQILGAPFDPNKPTVIYVHGWNVEKPNHVFGLPDHWVQQARRAGFNVMHFHWAVLSFDDGKGCPGPGWLGKGNIPCKSAHELLKKSGASDYFLSAYKAHLSQAKKPVRLVVQSLAGNFGLYVTYRMHLRQDFADIIKPNRVDIIDPFIMPGMGADRDVAYDGQIPPDDELPEEYKNNIVSGFVPGSGCRKENRGFIQGNWLSQYCQTEGMAYSLIKDFQVGIFTLSSIVGGLSARDLRRVSSFQSYSGSAWKGALTTRHTTPNAAYFYSFAPGTPKNGFDASSSDAEILKEAQAQIERENPVTRQQTKGLDTVTLMDDEYQLQ